MEHQNPQEECSQDAQTSGAANARDCAWCVRVSLREGSLQCRPRLAIAHDAIAHDARSFVLGMVARLLRGFLSGVHELALQSSDVRI
eukprot:4887807-Pyramimonas_sp.AAC.1